MYVSQELTVYLYCYYNKIDNLLFIATLGGILNSLVHIVMYTYYGLSSFRELRPYLWWKRYITDLQLVYNNTDRKLTAQHFTI